VSTVFEAIRWPFGIAVGTAVGGAAAGAITPGVQEVINEANRAHAVRPPAYFTLAQGVAQGQVDRGWAQDRAAEQGIGSDAFARLVEIADTGPSVGLAFELWRRNLIDDGGFGRALKRQAIEDEWIGPLRALKERLLSPAELANARQQEFIGDARLHDEGGKQGYDAERLDLLFKMAGLPPGPMDALQMLRRGIMDEATYRQLVAEGHTKTKYTDDLLALRWHILPGREWASLWLRGWVTEAEAKAGGALDGYDAAAMERLYQNRGRPATTRQVHLGYARGAKLAGAANEEEAIRTAVKQSNVRTEYADLLYAQRYTYPSAFVIRALAQDGTFPPDLTERILVESGWRPEWAKLAADKWGGGNGAGPSTKWADRAKTRLFVVAHNEFLDESIDEATARQMLGRVGAVGAEQDTIIAVWQAEASISRLELTPAQIRKAYKKGVYTEALALSELEERGMTPEDADTFLQSG
jgi:hypothetical protein